MVSVMPTRRNMRQKTHCYHYKMLNLALRCSAILIVVMRLHYQPIV
jgi:hypothetical protein